MLLDYLHEDIVDVQNRRGRADIALEHRQSV